MRCQPKLTKMDIQAIIMQHFLITLNFLICYLKLSKQTRICELRRKRQLRQQQLLDICRNYSVLTFRRPHRPIGKTSLLKLSKKTSFRTRWVKKRITDIWIEPHQNKLQGLNIVNIGEWLGRPAKIKGSVYCFALGWTNWSRVIYRAQHRAPFQTIWLGMVISFSLETI